jgi:hypothetical protein
LTPHINYDALSAAVVQVIKQRMKIDVKEDQIDEAFL